MTVLTRREGEGYQRHGGEGATVCRWGGIALDLHTLSTLSSGTHVSDWIRVCVAPPPPYNV